MLPKTNHLRPLVVCCLLLCCVSLAAAHPLGEVKQETRTMIAPDEIVVEYTTVIGPSIAIMLNPDKNGNRRLDPQEKAEFFGVIKRMLVPNVKLQIDDTDIQPEVQPGILMPSGGQGGILLSLYFSYKTADLSQGAHRLRIQDDNFRSGELDWLNYFVLVGPQITDFSVSESGRSLLLQFTKGSTGAAEAQATGADSTQERNRLTEFLHTKELSLGLILLALGVSLILGMSHALSPGHGKAMVAAYLIGTKGRIRDAVILGLTVTFTHVVSVILLGVLALFLTRYIVPTDIFPWMSGASGAIIFLVGWWLLARRALAGGGSPDHSHAYDHEHSQDHDHEHEHDHNHSHAHTHEPQQTHTHSHGGRPHSHVPPGDITLGSLLSLGAAGGMVPCPTALTVLLISVSVGRIPLGLAMIGVFSLGLALVLVLIGILTVTASRYTTIFASKRAWVERLPVFSAGLIMIIGTAIAVNGLLPILCKG